MPRRDFSPPPTRADAHAVVQIQIPDVTALVAKGYAVASLNYRLKRHLNEPSSDVVLAAFQDGKAAVCYLRFHAAKYRIDPDKFAVWGNSAGGYMAAILGVTGDQPTFFDDPESKHATVSSAIQAAVIWWGAIDGDDLRPEMRVFHYISSAKVLPPMLIANGDADPYVTSIQAARLHRALVEAGATSTLTILPGATHEDPVFMETQMPPTLAFLDGVFCR